MKKILGLLSSFTLLTTGITPLMGMKPNNQKKAPTLQEIITTIDVGYINKVSYKKIFNKLKEKKETFLSQPIFIENLEIISDIFLENRDFNSEYVNGYVKIKLKQNSNIAIKNNNKWIQVPENIIYTINFYTRNKNYVSSIKFYNWKPSFYIYK
ncbi:hypothetical protein M1770_02845 [Spiroplasma citri]|uniref:hypothetical protein n=1 Tax=Spiroplasma citri TaxID=2133 RepID=UPI002412561A|nr:hypothetical protein [Spiroplasma citri]WFG98923.1 hypothetical protein M1770_02845 [Spiroplasma citri]